MRILITGGLGQIGSHIAEALLGRGDSVLVIDNLSMGRRVHLPESDALKVVIGTISDRTLVYQLVAEFHPDVIIHAAASHKNSDDWYSDVETNCVGGVNIIEAAKEHKIKRFIYFQTALCYGRNLTGLPIKVDHIRQPAASSYAISKTTSEQYLELSGLDFVSFRLANIIGPRNLIGPLPIFFSRISNGQECYVTQTRRDFVFVRNLVKVALRACDGVGSGAYNFSSGVDMPVLELYNIVSAQLSEYPYTVPKIIEMGLDDVPSILLDPSRMFEDFGLIKFTDIWEAVGEAIQYYKKFGTSGEHSHLKLLSKKN
jgi:UDP-glucose 4-epimerase